MSQATPVSPLMVLERLAWWRQYYFRVGVAGGDLLGVILWVSVAEFVTGVDRLLTRAYGLFAAGGGDAGGVFAAGGGGSVPAPPAGGSGLGSGVAAAGGVYEQSQAGVSS